MPWQAALSISIIAGVAASLIQKSYSKRSTAPDTFPPAVSYALGVMPVGLVAGLIIFPHDIRWSWFLVILLAIEGVSMAVANWISFLTVRRMSIASFQTIGRFYGIVVVSLGWVVLNERLTMYQFIGASLLLIAAVLAIRAPLRHTSSVHKKVHMTNVMLTLLSATALGIALVTEKALLGHMDIGGVYIIGWSAQTLAMLILALKDLNRRNLKNFTWRDMQSSTAMGLASGLTGVFYVYAIYHSDNVSLVTALTAVGLPLTVFAAYIILKERENSKLMWGSLVISFFGLLISALH